MSNMQAPPDEISVVTVRGAEASDAAALRSPFSRGHEVLEVTNIKLVELAEGINQFLSQMDAVLKEAKSSAGDFRLSEVSVSAGIKASGKLTLFGIAGAESGVEGGLVFKFKKD
jgi:hypothetical protein